MITMNLWLTLHLIGVVIFVGNIITAAFWKVRADLTKNSVEIHSAVKNVMLADYIFTIPGLVLIIVSGSIMAARAGMPMSGFNWLMLSLILLAVTGIIWAVILIPLQLKMIRYSAQCHRKRRYLQGISGCFSLVGRLRHRRYASAARHFIPYGNERFLKGRERDGTILCACRRFSAVQGYWLDWSILFRRLAYLASRSRPAGGRNVPLYDVDGKTVISAFHVGN